ncbi:MAG TPA: Rieske 2Fe-2S domain-containing protein [Hyphomicrobiales bacterium]|nr:Rieske 2Fe-2S domain-containing protein [Hyphomicrobiales bacterium]
MLTADDNRLLTETGPGTPMGELFRRFWTPVLLSRDLPQPDSPPTRVRIFGEDFLALRFTDGTAAVIEPHCPHRGANLFFGRCEKGGIRCAYHGWKFAPDGRCLDMPNVEPGRQRDAMQAQIRLKTYPTREWGDFIWAYLGPDGTAPELPQMEFALVPPSHRYVSKKLQECNWAQSAEGGIDTAHFSFLHMSVDEAEDAAIGIMSRSEAAGDKERVRWLRRDGSPKFTVMEHPAGLVLGAARAADDGRLYWRISQFLMPNHGLAPNAFPGENYHGQTWVPIDDTSCWVFCYTWNPERPLTDDERAKFRKGHTVHGDIDAEGRPIRNRANDYLIDREEQRLRSFTGIVGVSEQDAAIQDSQGFIADRTHEYLVPTDLGIVRFRRLMMESARRLTRGEAPPAASAPEAYAVRSGGAVAPAEEPLEAVMMERFGSVDGRAARESVAS